MKNVVCHHLRLYSVDLLVIYLRLDISIYVWIWQDSESEKRLAHDLFFFSLKPITQMLANPRVQLKSQLNRSFSEKDTFVIKFLPFFLFVLFCVLKNLQM